MEGGGWGVEGGGWRVEGGGWGGWGLQRLQLLAARRLDVRVRERHAAVVVHLEALVVVEQAEQLHGERAWRRTVTGWSTPGCSLLGLPTPTGWRACG